MRAYLIAVCLCLASFLLPASLAARQQDMSTTAFDFHFPSIEGGQLRRQLLLCRRLVLARVGNQPQLDPLPRAAHAQEGEDLHHAPQPAAVRRPRHDEQDLAAREEDGQGDREEKIR